MSRQFTIENRMGYGRLHLGDGRHVWRSFTATAVEPEAKTGLRVELDIEVDRAGNPHCRGLRLLAQPQEWGDSSWITTTLVRDLKVAQLVKGAFNAAIEVLTERELPSGDVVLELDTAAIERELDAVVPRGAFRSKNRQPQSNDELEQLANFYKRVVAKGGLPTNILATRMKVDASTVRRWWKRCEDAGFLNPEDRLDHAAGGRASRRSV